jgi:pilus assembly protein CpaF
MMPTLETIAESQNANQPLAQRGVGESVQQQLKSAVHKELIKRLDLDRLTEFHQTHAGQQQLFGLIQHLFSEQGTPLSGTERDKLAQEVVDEVFGLGPLEPLLNDPTISDILVNTCKSVYVERRGLLEKTTVSFKDDRHLMHIIDKIVSAVGRRVDESSPMVDARLADGSRVNVIIPPLAVDGPILSIRRFGSTPLTAEDLLQKQMLTAPMLEVLKSAVRARLNIVISGGTGAGKTTLLNVLSGFIDEKERIVTIEDSAELLLKQEHVVRLETRPSNMEGNGGVRQRELVINALRMRPGHAAGHEHRPRWIADHDPLQHSEGRSFAHGDHDDDGRNSSAGEGHQGADIVRHRPDCAGSAHERWHAPHHPHHRAHGSVQRCHQHE